MFNLPYCHTRFRIYTCIKSSHCMHTLNLYNIICQLYLNKRGKNHNDCIKAAPVTFSFIAVRWFYNLKNVDFIFERGLLTLSLWWTSLKAGSFFFLNSKNIYSVNRIYTTLIGMRRRLQEESINCPVSLKFFPKYISELPSSLFQCHEPSGVNHLYFTCRVTAPSVLSSPILSHIPTPSFSVHFSQGDLSKTRSDHVTLLLSAFAWLPGFLRRRPAL